MKNNQKGMALVSLVAGVVVVSIILGYFLYLQNSKKQENIGSAVPSAYQAQYQEASEAVTPVNDTSGLNAAVATLDEADMSQLDTNLNALGSASAGF